MPIGLRECRQYSSHVFFPSLFLSKQKGNLISPYLVFPYAFKIKKHFLILDTFPKCFATRVVSFLESDARKVRLECVANSTKPANNNPWAMKLEQTTYAS